MAYVPASAVPNIFPLSYQGRSWASLTEFRNGASPPCVVSLNTLGNRLRARAAAGPLTDDVIRECYETDAATYKARYATRKTPVPTTGGTMSGEAIYSTLDPVVSYPTFRQRINANRTEDGAPYSDDFLKEAARLPERDWIIHYGGGRRKGFTYEGDEYPDFRGDYTGFTSFLKRIGRWEERDTLQARRMAQWAIDDLLREGVRQTGQQGFIYSVTEIATGRAYVGLTVNQPRVRFGQHLASVAKGSRNRFHQALADAGAAAFKLDVLEEVAGDDADLAEAERRWIDKLDSRGEVGLNSISGGSVGKYYGIAVEHEGRKFRSKSARDRKVAKEMCIPEHVVSRALEAGRQPPARPRRASKHPEAGSPLFRQHLGILKRARETGAGLEPGFEDYDAFKAASLALEGVGDLTRIDTDKPWGPANICLMSNQEIVDRSHGKEFKVGELIFHTKEAALKHFGIPRNVFDHRIKKGWSDERAITEPLGKNRKQPFSFCGVDYPSKSECCRVLAKIHGRTPDQIKDYLYRKLAIEDWPKR